MCCTIVTNRGRFDEEDKPAAGAGKAGKAGKGAGTPAVEEPDSDDGGGRAGASARERLAKRKVRRRGGVSYSPFQFVCGSLLRYYFQEYPLDDMSAHCVRPILSVTCICLQGKGRGFDDDD